jgi:putative endonuclease
MTALTPTAAPKQWCLYLIECANKALYAGITNDLTARFEAHKDGRGAKFTRANPPVRIVASCAYPDRSAASRAEYAVKQLPRRQKVAFVLSQAQPA